MVFKHKKRLREIELTKQKNQLTLDKIQKEKEELQNLKALLENKYPKIDISNVYILGNNLKYIVRVEQHEITGKNILNQVIYGSETCFTNIFNDMVILNTSTTSNPISEGKVYFIDDYVPVMPICKVERALLAYTDQKVPLYILQQLYYKLNNADLNSPILRKQIRDIIPNK